jgi:hypothetical protein
MPITRPEALLSFKISVVDSEQTDRRGEVRRGSRPYRQKKDTSC